MKGAAPMRNALFVPDALLVSSPNGGGMVVVDGWVCLPISSRDATGIAVDAEAIRWCLQEDGARTIRQFSDGQFSTTTLQGEALDLHDLLASDRQLFAAATQTNEVLRLDADLAVVQRWDLGGAEQDAWHVNCLAIADGRLLASIFGRFDATRGYKGRTRGAGEVIDVRSGETLIGGLSQPHSLVAEGAQLWLCSSEEKQLHVYEEGKRIRTVALPGYARGLALGDDHVYVGLSCSRNLEVESQTGYFESGAVMVLRRDDLSPLGAVQLPWREVYDIRIVRDRRCLQSLLAASWELERAEEAAGREVESEAQARRVQETERDATDRLEALRAQHERDLREARAAEAEATRRAAELQAQLDGLRNDLQVRTLQVADLHASHAQADAQVIRGQAEIDARDTRLGILQQTLRSRDEDSVRRSEEFARIAETCEAQARSLEEAANEAARLRAEVARREAQAAQREQAQAHALVEAADEAARLRADVARAEAQAAQREQAQARALAETADEAARLRAEVARRETQAADLGIAHESALRQLGEATLAGTQARAEAESQAHRASDLALRVTHLQDVEREFDIVLHSRSWRLTRPLRFLMRVLRHGALRGDDREKLQSLLGRAPQSRVVTPALPEPPRALATSPGAADAGPVASLPAKPARRGEVHVQLAAPEDGLEDVFVWAVIDWHFRIQRPQHMARELAASGRRVFYISNNFIDAPDPGFKVEPLDGDGRLFQVFLNVRGKPAIYFTPPDDELQARLEASLRLLLQWTRSQRTVSLVQHPFWSALARTVPNHRLVYDCMDHHGGFEDNAHAILALEEGLMRSADLLVVSSAWLDEEGAGFNARRALIRNAGQYEHFATRPDEVFADEFGRRVIGYYGAIASWFDVALVAAVARANPDCLVLLVGADTCGAQEALVGEPNVSFTGEVPYATLPFYLYGFDVCMLPFKVLPLTLATNPVKAYEYLAAGKPLVTVDLPEMHQFGTLVRICGNASDFVEGVRNALAELPDDPVRERRRAFAADQTWARRADELVGALARIEEPRVSVIVLAYNNLELTKACLASLEACSDYPNLELIVVDNASSDGTPEFLRTWERGAGRRRVLLNEDNKGFAGGNNQGLAVATGDYLVLLNNDTQVTPGWVRTLRAHLARDPGIGIIGPVTNNIGNEARIDIEYLDARAMIDVAGDYTRRHAGVRLPIRTVAFFCVMLPRTTYERVGGLDEAFGTGFFEDDDYCRRVEAAGLTVACADDVFVHHHLSASFNKLAADRKQALFERNKAIYESKWGAWTPHSYRGAGGQ
jgi:GT2 family glycosyltransferase/glycosyltransferase involved in cell wall biosynthesis